MALDLFLGFIQWLALLFVFTFHNYLKAITVIRLGDDTPRRLGLDTLNPLPHMDLLGTVILPAVFILLKSPLILGWPKMVPIDYSRFRDLQKAVLTIAAVGILSYFFIGFLAYALYTLLEWLHLPHNIEIPLSILFQFTFIVSVFFGFLNLLPIPPLDMGFIVLTLLGKSIEEIHIYGFFGSFLILFLFIVGFIPALFQPIYAFLLSLL